MTPMDLLDRLAYPMPEMLLILLVVAVLAPIADLLERRHP